MLSTDASALRQLGKNLSKSSPAIMRAVRNAVRQEGRKVAADARHLSDWSTRIPDSIHVIANGLIGVTVRAGGPTAPHAAPYENRGKFGTFRHPLNYPNQGRVGHGHWVSQKSRPYLHPAAVSRLEEIQRAIVEAAMAPLEERMRDLRHEEAHRANETDF